MSIFKSFSFRMKWVTTLLVVIGLAVAVFLNSVLFLNPGYVLHETWAQNVIFTISTILFLTFIFIFFQFHSISSLLREAMATMNSAAFHLIASAEQQATGANEQAVKVAEITSTHNDLAKSTGEIAGNAQRLSQYAENTLHGILLIDEKINVMAKRMMKLGEKSQAIDPVTQFIDSIAEQTNLLALNASIEAARAGESGRGFAVVASEIRKLAEKSAQATKEIRQTLHEMQDETGSVVMSVEEATKSASKGIAELKQTVEVIKDISSATQKQKNAAEQVAVTMRDVDTVTKQFAEGTQQIVSLSNQLMGLVKDLKKFSG